MKNKKGEENLVVNNVTGLVVAIIAIFVIVAFIYVAITQLARDNELEAAKSLAERIKSKIDLIETGKSVNLTFQSSKYLDGWFLMGWGKEDASKPDKCFFSKSCLCVCEGTTADACQKKGICRDFNVNQMNITRQVYQKREDVVQSNILGEHVPGDPLAPTHQIVDKKNIPLPKNFFVVEITKKEDSIIIRYPYPPQNL